MAQDLSRLNAAVTAGTTVKGSVITLLTNLSQLLRDAAGDQAAVNAIADQLDAHNREYADAVIANTPAAPPA